MKTYQCSDCGASKSRKGIYCKPCGYKHRAKTGFKVGHEFYPGAEKGWFSKGHRPWSTGTKGILKANSGSIKPGEHLSVNTEFKTGQYRNDKHPLWKGDNVGYSALHTWIYRNKTRSNTCEQCYEQNIPTHFANLDYEYTRDVNTWGEMCAKCHNAYDRRNGWGIATKKFKELQNV